MTLTHEYIKHRSGYSLGAGACWIRIYAGSPSDAPVVVCESVAGNVDEMASQLAAEVIREHFPEGLLDLPRPLLWVEHRPPRRHGPGKFFLLTFPSYRPRLCCAGFVRRFALGEPSREKLTASEVDILTGEGFV